MIHLLQIQVRSASFLPGNPRRLGFPGRTAKGQSAGFLDGNPSTDDRRHGSTEYDGRIATSPLFAPHRPRHHDPRRSEVSSSISLPLQRPAGEDEIFRFLQARGSPESGYAGGRKPPRDVMGFLPSIE